MILMEVFDMFTFSYTITDEVGIHARPAAQLAMIAQKYKSSVMISKGGKTIDAKRLIALMSLGASKNDTVTVTVEGSDETAAGKALTDFFEKNI